MKKQNKLQSERKPPKTAEVKVSMEGIHLTKDSSSLTPERIAEIVRRINANFYDREDVLQVVAERILESPELQDLLKNERID